ncbi:MAG: diacylglycerol/polyprenol kinase family protein [Cyanobacteria bacterium J06633_2]
MLVLASQLAPLQSLTPSISTQLIAISSYLGLVALTATVTQKFFNAGSEVIRKVVHIGTGNVIVLAWLLQVPSWIGITASIIFSLVTLLSYQFPLLPFINSVGRKSFGTFFYALSIGLLISYFWPIGMPFYAVLGVLVMSWGDGLAALIGQRWGTHPYEILGINKSWEGSSTMLITTFVVSVVILGSVQGLSGVIVSVAAAIALASTLLEAFSKWGIDNLTVPLGSAAIAYGLCSSLLG